MAINFSDLFGSAGSETATDKNAGADADVSNDGVAVEAESYSRDEDGSVSYDRTSADTGQTTLAGGADGDSVFSGNNEAAGSSGEGGGSGGGRGSGNDGTGSADGTAGSRSDQGGDAYGEAGNSGIVVERESYSRDEDGSESYDAGRADTGESDIGFDLDVANMADSMSGLSGTSEDEGAFD